MSVTVDPQGLTSGQYYGTVEVDAPDAGNSPKSVTVSLRVLDPGTFPPPDATPSGLILVGQTAQSVTLANHSSAALSYSSTVVTEDGQPWLTGVPAGGNVLANGTAQISVQANLAGLSPRVVARDNCNRFFRRNAGQGSRSSRVQRAHPATA